MSVLIDRNLCARCGSCVEACPGNLIKQDAGGTAFLKHPEECWGCASCLKECRHGAISYYLGADIGGQGGRMRVTFEGPLCHWEITPPRREDGQGPARDGGPGSAPVIITVDRRNANQY